MSDMLPPLLGSQGQHTGNLTACRQLHKQQQEAIGRRSINGPGWQSQLNANEFTRSVVFWTWGASKLLKAIFKLGQAGGVGH